MIAGTHGLGGVACGSATTCEAVGQNITAQGAGVGVVVPITNGVPGTAQTAFGTVTLNDVSCPNAATCVALGGNITAQPGSGGVVVPITDGAPAVPARGRMAYYRLDDAHVRMLLDLGLTHTEHTAAVHTAAPGTTDTGQRP